jgi:hypothetical protein
MSDLIGEQGPEEYSRKDVITLGLDPGKMVGYSNGSTWHGASSWDEFLLLFDPGQFQRVAVESFHTRNLTTDAELTIQVIGGILTLCARARVPVGWVVPSMKRKTMGDVPDDYTNRHERDAEAIRLWDLRYGNWG